MTPGGGFFARRWRREIALPVLLWRDMVGVGTAINLLATFAALMLAAKGFDAWVAAALHFAPLPYNVFLFLAVWRMPRRRWIHSATTTCWLLAMTIV